ncbi:hypothetical protein HS041_32020 [Planomonospora sp. ID67723]|uniref:hypothetical protein n=1 Tax=Planomonospora sp. ID67723 TaxID=2738134 RepID=UPI0018C405B9|nr:hypothetical protein [Planomonospora sp. ID67723]MBG0832335.1 hypothetical protein [Planomonospora sp. ID67723]
MGRHGGRGDELPRHQGEDGPEPAPDPDDRGEPAGRRLRPEQAATAEIWGGIGSEAHGEFHNESRDESRSEHRDEFRGESRDEFRSEHRDGLRTGTPTGFLGSGWSAGADAPDPVWPGEERRSGGWIKLTLLAVTAVVAVTGGTVLGVQAWKSPDASVAGCSGDACLAGASNRPEPEAGTPEPGGEPDPSQEPAGAEGATTSPVPVPSATRRGAGPARRSSPAPTATRVPQSAETAPPEDESLPTEEPPSERDAGELIDIDDRTTPTPTPTPTPTQATPTPVVTDSPRVETPAPTEDPTITVGFGVLKERPRSYTAELVVAADERVRALELALPVNGEVASVAGARWRQDGGTLVIESAGGLKAGEELVVTFVARGRAEAPQACRSVQGDCSVV